MNGSVADRCILMQQAGYNILTWVRVEGRWQSKLAFDDLVRVFFFLLAMHNENRPRKTHGMTNCIHQCVSSVYISNIHEIPKLSSCIKNS
jgi:hypothetical protein